MFPRHNTSMLSPTRQRSEPRSVGPRRGVGVLAAAAAVAALTLAGCGGGGGTRDDSSSTALDKNATLRAGFQVVQTLSPKQTNTPGTLAISSWPVYDRLIQVNPDAVYEPMLATKWSFSPDGKKLSLTLRDDVTFSDGEKFDAQAVKANLDYSMAAQGTALGAGFAAVESVQVTGTHAVDIGLKAPTTTILSVLSSALGGAMISPRALAGSDLDTHPVGTGAYVIESFQPGQQIVYKRRTDPGGIWDPKTGNVARIELKSLDADGMSNAVKTGQIDVALWGGDESEYRAQLAGGKLRGHLEKKNLGMAGLYLNRTMPPFDNVLVRQAVNFAIDREQILDAFMPGAAPRVQPWPSQLVGYDPALESTYAHNPEKARKLLAEAGFPKGVDGGEFLVATDQKLPKVAEAVQANLAEVGIRIKLKSVDLFTLVTAYGKGQAPGQLMYLAQSSIDPMAWLQRLFVNPMFVPGGPTAELGGLLAGIDDPTITDAARKAKVGAVLKYATDQALYAPIYQGMGGYIASAKVKGFDDLASLNSGIPDLRNISIMK